MFGGVHSYLCMLNYVNNVQVTITGGGWRSAEHICLRTTYQSDPDNVTPLPHTGGGGKDSSPPRSGGQESAECRESLISRFLITS